MKSSFVSCSLGLLVGAAVLSQTEVQGATQTKTGVATATNAAPSILDQEIPKSVFVIPASPKDGRNPFFPQSAQVVAQPTKRDAPLDPSLFVLNGITPSGPKRTAMINGRTFEAGESGEVRLPSGSKMLIKCEEIRADTVVILVDGQRRDLRLRFGL